jgi:DNA-directed RNA polymerase subunit RPC12/RpoP
MDTSDRADALAGSSCSGALAPLSRFRLMLGPCGPNGVSSASAVLPTTPTMERTLSLTCRECGKDFASALQMDPETFTKIKVENNLERCSHCGSARRYQKDDYFFI